MAAAARRHRRADATAGAGPFGDRPAGGRAGARAGRGVRVSAGWLAGLAESAASRAAAGLRRELRPRGADDAVVDLAGNDYLGLSRHPDVIGAVVKAVEAFGLGATGSRLVRGSTSLHEALERELAGWLGCESALVFSSGYLANIAAVRGLARPGGLIVSDAHNHASLVDGCRLACAGRAGTRTVVVPHADVGAVGAALAAAGGGPAVVVTESVFSVDGDLAPLRALHSACREHGAVLLVDDAHAVGVLGPDGAGAVAAAGLSGEPDVVVTATLSKSLGAAGGVVAGPAPLAAHLVDTGRTFIYDTALAPAVAAGAAAALDLLRSAGLDVTTPAGGVISVTAPGPQEALAWAAACRAQGVAVGCFRPPSTPDGRSRLRLTVNVGVPREAFEAALAVVLASAP